MSNFYEVLKQIKEEQEKELNFAFTIATGTVEEAKKLAMQEDAMTICGNVANSNDEFEKEVGNIAFDRYFDILNEELFTPFEEEELCSTL